MRTTDIFSEYSLSPASDAHAMVIDLLAACGGPRDEKILYLRLNGSTQEDIAHAMGGMLQSSVSRILARLYRYAGIHDEDTPPRVGQTLRASPGWRNVGAEAKQPRPPGLRFPIHTPGHRKCWCAKREVARCA